MSSLMTVRQTKTDTLCIMENKLNDRSKMPYGITEELSSYDKELAKIDERVSTWI